MAKIYKLSDRIKIKIDDILIKVAPLSVDQKNEVHLLMVKGAVTKDYKLLNSGIRLSLKYALKDLQGIKLASDENETYVLSFDENGNVTDECIDEIFNLEMNEKIVMVCQALAGKIPEKFTDEKGQPIEGVELIGVEKKAPTVNP